MDDALRVRVIERIGDLRAELENVPESEGRLAEEPARVRARDDRHHEEQRALVPAQIVDRHDPGVVHLRDDLRLAEEALLETRAEASRRNQLHRDIAREDRVARAIDHAHAAPPELSEDLVTIGESRADQKVAPELGSVIGERR